MKRIALITMIGIAPLGILVPARAASGADETASANEEEFVVCVREVEGRRFYYGFQSGTWAIVENDAAQTETSVPDCDCAYAED